MRDPRPTFSARVWSTDGRELLPTAADKEIREAYAGYYAYFGTYKVDETAGTVSHHVQGSLRPSEVGMDYVRRFTIAADTLTLSLTFIVDGESRTRMLTWRRVESLVGEVVQSR